MAFANAPKVGRSAAARYFQNNGQKADQPEYETGRGRPRSPNSEVAAVSADDHYLTLGISTYTSSDAYNWGQSGKEEKVGKSGIDMSYRIGQYSNLVDDSIRVSYNEYNVTDQRATKLSLLYAWTLPDASSRFPLYFGFGAGPGIFFKQLSGESAISLDYQLYLGLRLFNIFENTGFYVEGGLKNHLHLTSDGQLNGTYISAGAVFTF
ncbi:MAG: hypothetical protein H7256_08975 [Bdellovibrio sp.]|nr:hypothetical protein [Bdellovibrio sp.]